MSNSIITIISSDGEITETPKLEGEKDHSEAFARACVLIPGLLDDFQDDPKKSGGFEYARFVAATGNVVIWPTNINNDQMMIISLPKDPTPEQMTTTIKILPTLKEKEVYANVCRLKKPRSSVIISETLSSSGDFLEAYGKIVSYFNKVNDMNSMLTHREEEPMEVNEYLSTLK